MSRELPPVGCRADPKPDPEVVTQVCGAAIAGKPRDLLQIAPRLRLQQPLRFPQPCDRDPLAGRDARRLLESALETAQAHARPFGQHRKRQVVANILAHPVEERAQPFLLVIPCHRADNELRLSAFAMRRHDQAARDTVGRVRPEIPSHDMQAEIDAGRTAGRRQNAAVVDIKHGRIKLDIGEACCNRGGIAPVSRRFQPVEKAGLRQNRDSRAERHHARAAPIGVPQSLQQRFGCRGVDRPPARNHDEIGLRELI